MKSDLLNKIIFGKYKVNKVIGTGSFGSIFQGKNIINKELVAIKTEADKKQIKLLESEAYFLFYLKNFGIPEVKSFGIYKNYKVLVETLLGDDLVKLFNKHKKMNMKDFCMIFIQLIDRLEYIHSKYIIHRDIKPENIMFDLETKKIIYLIDFGLAKKYRSSKTKKHISYSVPNILTGSERYCSINVMNGVEQSRRDDLESAGYVMIYLSSKKCLPWIQTKIKSLSLKERFNYIKKIKNETTDEKLCENLPKAFCDYMKYVKKLRFEEDPDYDYLRGLFIDLLTSLEMKNDLRFSWISKSKKEQNEILITKRNIYPRKQSGLQPRLLRKIEKIETEKKFKRKITSENFGYIINNSPTIDNTEEKKNLKEKSNMPIKNVDLNEKILNRTEIKDKNDKNNFVIENNEQNLINNQISITDENNVNQIQNKNAESYIINTINCIESNDNKKELLNDISNNDNIFDSPIFNSPLNYKGINQISSLKTKYNMINENNNNASLMKENELKNNSNLKNEDINNKFISKKFLNDMGLTRSNINYEKKMIPKKSDDYNENNFNLEKCEKIYINSNKDKIKLLKKIDNNDNNNNKNILKMNFNTINVGIFNSNDYNDKNFFNNIYNIINTVESYENKNFIDSKQSIKINFPNDIKSIIPKKYYGIYNKNVDDRIIEG